MRAIAKGRVLRMLAATEINGFAFLKGNHLRCKFRALVAAVAERLFLALATGAPKILFTCLYLYGVGGFLWYC